MDKQEFDGVPLSTHSAIALRAAELVAELQQHVPADIGPAFATWLKSATTLVPGAEHAGITIFKRDSDIETAAATHHYPAVLDEIQSRHRQGPCLSAAGEDHTIHVDDLTADNRWPGYRDEAIQQTPIRSILSFQLFADRQATGALTFYASSPHAFDHESVELGRLFATHTALAWRILRRNG